MSESSFTVYFEDPFWVGVYQRTENGLTRACKITFGSEPRDNEVYLFLLDNWHQLVFSPPVPGQAARAAHRNPKRTQRAIAKSLRPAGAGTKAQQALALARQEGKLERKAKNKAAKQAEAARRFALHTQKKKEKHKGH